MKEKNMSSTHKFVDIQIASIQTVYSMQIEFLLNFTYLNSGHMSTYIGGCTLRWKYILF